MPMSPFYKALRERVGTTLLLMPAVAALIRDGSGRFLLQQTPDGCWSLPAGAIEPGETPSVAVVREVFEETGLQVVPTRIAGVVSGAQCRTRYANGDEVEYTVVLFDCQIIGGELTESNEETRSLAWFHRAGMPPLSFDYPDAAFERSGAAHFVR